LEDLPDPRQRGKAMVPLDEVLLLALVAVPAEDWTVVDIAQFGAKKLPILRRLGLFAWFIRSGDWQGALNQCVAGEDFKAVTSGSAQPTTPREYPAS
jgi:hypothetical protein